MMMRRLGSGVFLIAAFLTACAGPSDLPAVLEAPMMAPARDALFTPEQVKSGRLEYAPDRSAFAPVLTQQFTYPTQPQAQNAFLRSQWPAIGFATTAKGPIEPVNADEVISPAAGVRIFACKPGALDGLTGRTVRFNGPVVVCATDFIGDRGEILWRAPINFFYRDQAWHMHDPQPSTTYVRWLRR
jgi:hypothetical protein